MGAEGRFFFFARGGACAVAQCNNDADCNPRPSSAGGCRSTTTPRLLICGGCCCARAESCSALGQRWRGCPPPSASITYIVVAPRGPRTVQEGSVAHRAPTRLRAGVNTPHRECGVEGVNTRAGAQRYLWAHARVGRQCSDHTLKCTLLYRFFTCTLLVAAMAHALSGALSLSPEPPIRVLVTGAAGQISYSLMLLIARVRWAGRCCRTSSIAVPCAARSRTPRPYSPLTRAGRDVWR